MNNLILQIPVKPLSVNKKFTINRYNRRMVKSSEAVAFEKLVESYLAKHKKDIDLFISSLEDRQVLGLDIVIYVPEKDFYTKKKTISLTCLDVSNTLKMLEDTIYKNIGINDALNVKISAEKRPTSRETYVTLINIHKLAIPKICPLDHIV